MAIRSRTLSFFNSVSQYGSRFDIPLRTTNHSGSGTQVTDSSGTTWHKTPRRDRGIVDVGSEFATRRPGMLVHSTPIDARASNGYRFIGLPLPSATAYHYDQASIYDGLRTEMALAPPAEVLAAGTTAISRVAPTAPVSGIATALGELKKDGLPNLMGSAAISGKRGGSARLKAGDEYLNYQFAVKPFVSDLKSFSKAVTRSKQIIAQLEKDSGKVVRRRYTFPPVQSVSIQKTVRSSGFTPIVAHTSGLWGTGSSYGTDVITTTVETRRWFSGAFSYHLNIGTSARDRLARTEQDIHKLYGSISLDTGWNLLPYSWLVDWVSNAGDVVKNISLFSRDGLVLRYGYIMEEKTITRQWLVNGMRFNPGVTGTVLRPSFGLEFSLTLKRRFKATPFGFGLDTGAFTARQWSILGALGSNRVNRRS